MQTSWKDPDSEGGQTIFAECDAVAWSRSKEFEANDEKQHKQVEE